MDSFVQNKLIVESKDVHFIELIGAGAYGEVWKATWGGKGGGITVAVKKIPMLGVTPKMQNETLNEVEILLSLRHPHILQMFGACIVQQELWIVMEFIDGGSLFDLLHSERELDWDIRLRLVHQAAISVCVLHASEIMHRDIKSQNFLVSKDCTTLKLIDFGLSKCISTLSAVPREVIGTIRWNAPEIFRYPPQWSMKADIYSLGVTFYEIASRQIPFEEVRDDLVTQFVSVQRQHPSIPDDCPKWFEDIIKECWNHDATKRPTAIELVDKLEKLSKSLLSKSLLSKPPLSEPPLSEPPLSEPPLSKPPLSEPPLSEPPLSEPPLSEPPLSEPPLSEPPLSEPPLSEPPLSEPPLSEPPLSKPPLSEPSLSKPPLSEPSLSKPPLSKPPLNHQSIQPLFLQPSPPFSPSHLLVRKEKRRADLTRSFVKSFYCLLRKSEDAKQHWKVFPIQQCTYDRCILRTKRFCVLQGGELEALARDPIYRRLGSRSGCACRQYY